MRQLQIVTSNRLKVNGTNWKEAIAFADGLGRTIKTQSIDNQGDVFAEMVYDNMGRAYLSSNPYRTGETKLWTQTNFDVVGRVKEVVTPDGAKVQTSYDVSTSGLFGTVVTVTDQANKQRRSITNALGQLMRVDEPDDNGNLGSVGSPTQPTNYSYDTLSNLVQVNQGVQVRTFSYDSLSRLKIATNPESGAINYNYDNNSNLTQKTDARGVITNYVYDNLNRVLNRTYNDGTPNVSYKYDNQTFAKGRLIQVASAISTTNYTNFDNLGRILNSQQITDGQTYNFGYSYNLSGALVNETYPSGRIVTNQFETDGDLAQVNGSFQGNSKTYVGNFSYTSAGAVSSLQLGNGRWENTTFNARLQPTQIGLGSSANAQDLWKVNYDYGNTDNNGNVKSQQITVPSQFTAIQNYSYDSLNRLKSANETISGSQTWKQTFTFDRYGNRKFDATQTTTLPNQSQNIVNPAIDTANNKFITGQGYIYDLSGNLIQDAQNRTFYYNAENKQKEVRDASNQIVGQYLYDGFGQRVKKISAQDTTIFVYDGSGDLAAEYLVTTSQSQAPTTSYLTEDTLGSPRVITDQAGNVQSRRDFRPFGEEIARPNYGTDKIRQKFGGYEKDNESDLDFAQARYFNEGHGRFQSPDSLMASASVNSPQTFNRYSYVMNNPLNLIDPTGMKAGCPEGQTCQFDNEGNEYYMLAGVVTFTGTIAAVVSVGTQEAVKEAVKIIEPKWYEMAWYKFKQGITATGKGLVTVGKLGGAAVSIILNPSSSGCGPSGQDADPVTGNCVGATPLDRYLQKLSEAEDVDNSQNESQDDKEVSDTKKKGGGKSGKKSNEKKKEASKKREQNHRDELTELEQQPRTQVSVQRIKKLKELIKHEQKVQRDSETHWRKGI